MQYNKLANSFLIFGVVIVIIGLIISYYFSGTWGISLLGVLSLFIGWRLKNKKTADKTAKKWSGIE